ANATMATIHDRMPVLLDRDGQSAWLDPAQRDPRALAPLMRPCPDGWLALHAVAPAVGDARREGAALSEPLAGVRAARDGRPERGGGSGPNSRAPSGGRGAAWLAGAVSRPT